MRAIFYIFMGLCYPLIVHVLVLWGAPHVAVALLAGVSLVYAALLSRQPWKTFGRAIVIYSALAALGVLNLLTDAVYALYLPPIVINLSLMALFAATLHKDSMPLVERLMRLEYKEALPPALQRYARQLTWTWSGFFALMALASLLLARFAPLPWWSLFVNVLNYVFIAVLFIGQYLYRFLRYREYGVFMPWHTLRSMLRVPLADPAHPFYRRGGARQ